MVYKVPRGLQESPLGLRPLVLKELRAFRELLVLLEQTVLEFWDFREGREVLVLLVFRVYREQLVAQGQLVP